MKPNPKWTAATLVVLAVAVSTMHALAIAPVPLVHESDGATAIGSKTYDESQTPSSRHSEPVSSITGQQKTRSSASSPGRGFTLRIFDGLEKMQIWTTHRDNGPASASR